MAGGVLEGMDRRGAGAKVQEGLSLELISEGQEERYKEGSRRE